MENNSQTGGIRFAIPTSSTSSTSPIIKVIGVGGGGGNAVNHMYEEGMHDVTYLLCNTDKKALTDSRIPNHLQLGKEGLGAGNRPQVAREAAEESIEEIKQVLDDGTKMVFITAGMGGGTGTGAAPIIARCAKEMGILTVGIVTVPFRFEGKPKIFQALTGVDEISKHVDALLVINNEKLREIYPELTVINAFEKANDTLSVAAKSIADIINMHGLINLDFNDVRTFMKDGGVALMSTAYGEGEHRVARAIEEAINSPLLNNNDIFNSKKVILNINFCGASETDSLMMEEMNEVHEFMSRFRPDVEMKYGLAQDPSLGAKVKITILATGFGLKNVPGMKEMHCEKTEQETQEEEERREHINDLEQDLYGSGSNAKTRRKSYVYIFKPEDMDNDEIISMVDSLPTYKRTREQLAKVRREAIQAEVTTDTNT
ncbi:MAG: cell division protein FtsZ [Bacteroidaceae bacterium]|nr:cell division protein FtsZ [Bacteroidaceae bacterium]